MKTFFRNLFRKRPANYFTLNSNNEVTSLVTNEKDFVLTVKDGKASYVVNQATTENKE